MTSPSKLPEARRAYYAVNKTRLSKLSNGYYHANKTLKGPTPGNHNLSEIDDETCTAICEICGRVAVKRYGKTKNFRCVKSLREDAVQYFYKIPRQKYREMLAAQDNKCAICRVTFNNNDQVDHDHSCCTGPKTCGKCNRKLLCPGCNTKLPALENTEWVRLALHYLGGDPVDHAVFGIHE